MLGFYFGHTAREKVEERKDDERPMASGPTAGPRQGKRKKGVTRDVNKRWSS
jgi:hypothetical protein